MADITDEAIENAKRIGREHIAVTVTGFSSGDLLSEVKARAVRNSAMLARPKPR